MNTTTASAIADIQWFLSAGVSSFERSPSGEMWYKGWLYSQPGTHRTILTARPMHEVHESARDEPNRLTLIRYGRVSRRLRALSAVEPLAAEALSLAFGNAGARWAAHDWRSKPARGREVALFPLVPHGVELVARVRRHELCAGCGHARSKHGERCDETVHPPKVTRCCHAKACACGGFRASLERSDADILRVEIVVDDVTGGKDALRRALIGRASREAGELLERSLQMWCGK